MVQSGESTPLPPMWPGFDSQTRRHMWVEFVVSSRPYSEKFFSVYSGFPPPTKTNISKFQFDLERTVTFLRDPIDLSVTNGSRRVTFHWFWRGLVHLAGAFWDGNKVSTVPSDRTATFGFHHVGPWSFSLFCDSYRCFLIDNPHMVAQFQGGEFSAPMTRVVPVCLF